MNSRPLPPSPIRRLILWICIPLLLVGLLVFGGVLAYRKWQPERLVRQAGELREKGDLRGAVMAARSALQIAPDHVPASRLIAEVAESTGSPDLVFWRRRVVDLEPGSLADELALARAGLNVGDLDAAQQALLLASRHAENSAEYHAAAGTFAVMHNRLDEALAHFETALRLAPENPTHRYNLATVQIQLPSPEAQKAGRQHLLALSGNPRYALYALRGLVANLLGARRPDEAAPLARRLAETPASTFADRLLLLQSLADSRAADLDTEIAVAREKAAADPQTAGKLISWLTGNGRGPEAVAWWEGLPVEIRADGFAASPVGWYLLREGNWPALLAVTSLAAPVAKGERIGLRHRDPVPDWGPLEYLRCLCRARALEQTGDAPGFRAEWGRVVTLVTRKGSAAQRVYRVITGWGWQNESVALLSAVAESGPTSDWALKLLAKHYATRRDSHGLLKVFEKIAEREPENRAAENNCTMLRLLLGGNQGTALRAAEKLAREAPANAAFVSTHALALHLAHKTPEAIRVIETLPAETRETPSVAAYYGIFLSAEGRTQEADRFLALGKKAKLLPEEETLLRNAETRNKPD